MFHHHKMQLVGGLIAFLMIFTFVAMQVVNTSPAHAATSQFRGVNWADTRDNFVNGPVIPSGLSTSDSYATTYAKATAILKGFQTNLGANTVRFGINVQTVSSSWWNSYIAAFDAASALGMNVMICPWAVPGANGLMTDSMTAFYNMWDTVINKYLSNSKIYFEIFNEPWGYSATAWTNFAAAYLAHYPNVPRGRIVVAGAYSDGDLGPVGSDSRLNGTLLSLHLYSVFGITHTTEAAWIAELNTHLAGYASRAIITEFGVPMTTGVNYNGPRDGDNNISYLYALTDTAHNLGIGTIYWPGLRNGDSFSMESLNGSGTNLYLTNNNASGLDRLKYGYGLTSGGGSTPTPTPTSGGNYYKLVNRNSGKDLDVSSASTADGGTVVQWTDNGGTNQQWSMVKVP
ncbi:MAG: cellulase family glycosylhydrolase [Ktedonobacteraceae bacterium]|nr:cellulase family glycosylhydrolase [Ktedonobacteraceae bacterium]